MYIPKKHKNLSTEAAIAFATKYSFATVIAIIEEQLEVVHIPLEIVQRESKHFITGHVARGNKMSQAIINGDMVTCIFSEPHSYISSSWYDHINVPTWNYIAVHAKGRFRLLDGKELLESLKQMVDHYEEGRANRYNMSAMPKDMLLAHLNGLTGFEIEIDSLEANYKLSQNRNDKNYKTIIGKLKDSDNVWDKEIADYMIQERKHIEEK